MVIMGIDPGFAIMGFGFIQADGMKMKAVEYGVIRTSAKQAAPQRLVYLYDHIRQLIEQFRPDAIVFEELFFSNNVTTALMVGHARGAALVSAARHTQELFEYTPMQVKQAVVGYGHADKHQVQQMVKVLLKLKEMPKPDDAADALAVAICHAQSQLVKDQFYIK